jgi:hypothetical protein
MKELVEALTEGRRPKATDVEINFLHTQQDEEISLTPPTHVAPAYGRDVTVSYNLGSHSYHYIGVAQDISFPGVPTSITTSSNTSVPPGTMMGIDPKTGMAVPYKPGNSIPALGLYQSITPPTVPEWFRVMYAPGTPIGTLFAEYGVYKANIHEPQFVATSFGPGIYDRQIMYCVPDYAYLLVGVTTDGVTGGSVAWSGTWGDYDFSSEQTAKAMLRTSLVENDEFTEEEAGKIAGDWWTAFIYKMLLRLSYKEWSLTTETIREWLTALRRSEQEQS